MTSRRWAQGVGGLVLGLVAVGVAGCYLGLGGTGPILKLPGVVEVQEVRLGSKYGGRVAEVHIREGQIVEPGQILVRFEAPELEALRDQYRSRVAAAQAQWQRAQTGSRPDEIVAAEKAWQALAAKAKRLRDGWRTEEKRMAESDLATSEADLLVAKEKLARIQTARARSRDAVTDEELDQAIALRNMALGRRDNARAKYEMFQAGTRPEEVTEAEALADQALANFRLVKDGPRPEDKAVIAAQLQETQARLKEVEAQLAEATLRAPEKAVVEVLAVRKGDLVPPNVPVVRVLRAEDLWVKVYVPEPDLGKLRLNQECTITLDAYPKHQFHGTVMQMANESEFTPRNVQSANERRHQVFGVKVRVEDPQGVFKAGLAAEVTFPLAGPTE